MGRGNTAKILAATMLGTLDTAALLPLIAFYAIAVGADTLTTGIIVGLYSAVHAPANLLFGRYIDRTGRKRPLAIGLAWDAASLLLYVLASSPLLLALARISHGVGGGLIGPSSMSLVADSAPPERKGRGMALYGIAIATAVIVGNGIAGPLIGPAEAGRLAPVDYHRVFYILSVALVVGAAIALSVREPTVRPEPRRFRWSALRAFASRREPAAGYAGVFSLYFTLGAFVALVPPHLESSLGYGPREVAFSFTVFAVMSLLFHYPAGVLSDRFGPAGPSLLGLAAIAAAMATLPLATGTLSVVSAMALFGLGHGFVFASSSAFVARRADRENLGVFTGFFYTVIVLGVAVGAPVMAAVASVQNVAFGIWASAWAALLGVAFVARAWLRPEVPIPRRRAGRASGEGPATDR
jgi:MFS family permease